MGVLGLDSVFTFGKYKGEQVEDILDDDREYIVWLTESTDVEFDTEVYDILNN